MNLCIHAGMDTQLSSLALGRYSLDIHQGFPLKGHTFHWAIIIFFWQCAKLKWLCVSLAKLGERTASVPSNGRNRGWTFEMMGYHFKMCLGNSILSLCFGFPVIDKCACPNKRFYFAILKMAPHLLPLHCWLIFSWQGLNIIPHAGTPIVFLHDQQTQMKRTFPSFLCWNVII